MYGRPLPWWPSPWDTPTRGREPPGTRARVVGLRRSVSMEWRALRRPRFQGAMPEMLRLFPDRDSWQQRRRQVNVWKSVRLRFPPGPLVF